MNKVTLFIIAFLLGFQTVNLDGHDNKAVDRSDKKIGKVLVFSGTGWYRHPETAAISGWLARLSDDLKMQVDVTESAKDLKLLDRYQVLVLNNSNQLTSRRIALINWNNYCCCNQLVSEHVQPTNELQQIPWQLNRYLSKLLMASESLAI